LPGVGTAIGSFVGTLLGTYVGDLVGDIPGVAQAHATLVLQEGGTNVSTSYDVYNGGSEDLARTLARTPHDSIESIIDNVGGVVAKNINATIGYEESATQQGVLYYPIETNQSKLHTGAGAAVRDVTWYLVSNVEIAGGDILLKRAMESALSTNIATLTGNLQIAADYKSYLNDRATINALIALNPNTAFAAGWAITLARADELGLTDYQTSDFFGGLRGFLSSFDPASLGASLSDVTVSNTGGAFIVEIKISAGATVPGEFHIYANSVEDVLVSGQRVLRFTFNDGLTGAGFVTPANQVPGSGTMTVTGTSNANDLWIGGDGVTNTYNAHSNSRNDILVGGNLADVISGGKGWDWIEGRAGSDTLYGGDGYDVLRGGAGADILEGGDGNDTYLFNRGDGADTVLDSGGNGDRLEFGKEITPDHIVIGSNGNDLIVGIKDPANPGVGFTSLTDKITLQGWLTSNNRIETFKFANGVILSAAGILALYGTENNDTLTFTSEPLVLSGQAGNDVLTSGASADTLFGNGGDDTLYGGEGDDVLDGGQGADDLRGNDGTDFASYQSAAAGITVDAVTPTNNTGDAAGDLYTSIEGIRGTAYNDVLKANGLISKLDGGAGNDALYGGNGEDRLIGGLGADALSGDAGTDLAGYDYATAGVYISLTNPSQNTGEAAGDTYNSIEGLVGSAWADELYGNTGVNKIYGGAGDDKIFGLSGADNLFGDDGNDIIEGSVGADNLTGGNGVDSASYVGAAARVTASLANAALNTGEAQSDTYTSVEGLIGSAFDDTLYGDGGSNVLAGGVGNNDRLEGGAGDDTYVFNRGDGSDTVYDDYRPDGTPTDGGSDTLAFGTGITVSDIVIGSVGDKLVVGVKDPNSPGQTFMQLTDKVTLNDWNKPFNRIEAFKFLDGTILTTAAIIGLFGTDQADTYVFPNVAAVIDGKEGNDNLTGGTDDDLIKGGNGDDALKGGDGDDILEGGAGTDTLNGQNGVDLASYATWGSGVTVNLLTGANPGNDTFSNIEGILGSAFGDSLTGNGSANSLYGAAGNDSLFGGNGDDRLLGGLGADALDGGSGTIDIAAYDDAAATDTNLGIGITASLATPLSNTGEATGDTYTAIEGLAGTAFADNLTGDTAVNRLYGAGGNDALFGEGGNDKLYGEDGDDILIGGAGADELVGDIGTDYASYQTASAGLTARIANPGQNTGDAVGDTYTGIEGLIGSAHNDTLSGNASDNFLIGGAGNDSLEGQGGKDTLTGGLGNDTFIFKSGFGKDTVTDFVAGAGAGDVLQFQSGLFANVAAIIAASTAFGDDTIITLNSTNYIMLKNVSVTSLHTDDFAIV
jgi:Ca2+-binding RTX toxin-like protein